MVVIVVDGEWRGAAEPGRLWPRRRRTVVAVLLAAPVGAVAVIVAAVAAAGSPNPAGGYVGPREPPAAMPPEAAAHQLPDGPWVSRLLPFAEPFPTREALERAVADAREQGLIG